MEFIHFRCPKCQGVLFLRMEPGRVVNEETGYEMICPLCSDSFAVGVIPHFPPVALRRREAEVADASTHPTSGGFGGPGGWGNTPNNQRSNVMNPNNSAYQAAMSNRSNQLNPNNPAYRASRSSGRGRGK